MTAHQSRHNSATRDAAFDTFVTIKAQVEATSSGLNIPPIASLSTYAILLCRYLCCCVSPHRALSTDPRRLAASGHAWGDAMAGIERLNETASRGAHVAHGARPGHRDLPAGFLRRRGNAHPDGQLWIDRLKGGLEDTAERPSAADGERIVRLVAHHVGAEVHPGSPRVSAELPETGERFEGLIPPVVAAPAFAIRKRAGAVFTLDDYVAAGIMQPGQADLLRLAVQKRKNVLVAGRHLHRQDRCSTRCLPKSPASLQP